MLFAFFLSLLAVSSVFADLDTKICTKELAGVVYIPKTCSYEYLKSINHALQAQAPLLWSTPSQAQSVIQNFQVKYKVSVIIGDAFGKVYNYPGGPEITNYPKLIVHSVMQAYGVGEGFNANVNYLTYPPADTFTSLYWSPDGRMYSVSISKATSKSLNVCC